MTPVELLAVIGLNEAIGYTATALAGFLSAIAVLKWLRREPTEISVPNQPVMTKPVERYVTVDHCATVNQGITEHLRRHDIELAQLRVDAKADTARVLQHVESVRVELAGKMDSQAKEFGQALRDVPSRVIADLRNTGALRR